ncbi:hypothetical protein V5799_010161 [Amblyomma americanum]|uniref:Uncharacterized protein n=1 Tax=Amblyomma americanum TaxID=6943 RepID=A0AAQ4F9X8_AMBAM
METDPANAYCAPPASPASDEPNAADSPDPTSAVGAAPSAISCSGGSQSFPPPPDSLSCSAVGVDSSSPLPSASSLAPVPEATTRKPLIGDSSCLSFDFECSCTQPENKGSKASPASSLPAREAGQQLFQAEDQLRRPRPALPAGRGPRAQLARGEHEGDLRGLPLHEPVDAGQGVPVQRPGVRHPRSHRVLPRRGPPSHRKQVRCRRERHASEHEASSSRRRNSTKRTTN